MIQLELVGCAGVTPGVKDYVRKLGFIFSLLNFFQ